MALVTFPLSDTDRFMLSVKAVFSVSCPKCKARPGRRCQSTGGGNVAEVGPHKARHARIVNWSDAQLIEFAALVEAHRATRKTWTPEGYYAASEAAAASPPESKAKPATPKGVRLTETQAERIEWAAQSGGKTSASTAHFHGDAAERQTVLSLVGKGILVEGELIADDYERRYYLTSFGWQVYRHHRLIIRRLSDDDIAAGEVAAVAREQEGKASDE